MTLNAKYTRSGRKRHVYEFHKQQQVLEESFSDLHVKEEALLKKEEHTSDLQKKTEALLKESGNFIF